MSGGLFFPSHVRKYKETQTSLGKTSVFELSVIWREVCGNLIF
jgi:hypothetical protein